MVTSVGACPAPREQSEEETSSNGAATRRATSSANCADLWERIVSADRDTWAFGPAGKPTGAPPPRPDAQPISTPTPRPHFSASHAYEEAESWKRIVAVLGVIWAFLFFLTIPGWLAMSHRKKWKRGEIGTPFGLIWWGYGFGVLLLIGVFSTISSPS
jgi:hypothetical protein